MHQTIVASFIANIHSSIQEKEKSPHLCNFETNWEAFRNKPEESANFKASLETEEDLTEDIQKFIQIMQKATWECTPTIPYESKKLNCLLPTTYNTWRNKIIEELKSVKSTGILHSFGIYIEVTSWEWNHHVQILIKRLGYFPVQWLVAALILIQKQGKLPNQPESYRPISILPLLSKVIITNKFNTRSPILVSKSSFN